MKRIFLTGAAGFIGSNLLSSLLSKNFIVMGIDNLNDYYNPEWKKENLKELNNNQNFVFRKIDIRDTESLEYNFRQFMPDCIIHLASMAGVRYSIQNPYIYQDVNITGTLNLLEYARKYKTKKFIFSSSSSVYGNSKIIPYKEDNTDIDPISPYASSKRSAELLCKVYSTLYNMNIICLRFFTVYGPKGRPDMAPYIFTEAILRGKEIIKFGDGTTSRDYTYVDDIVDGIIASISINEKFEIINLGNSSSITLNEFISTLELITNKKANIIYKPLPLGDVEKTYADLKKAKKYLNYYPRINLKIGLKRFVEWYLKYRK